ncbi:MULTISPECIES: VPA1267 family protein [unclassified Pseudoalteromonas]|uniref:VPA1267 family protein n=1 Tax=Pseudoalteromonas TaxID=53246 RepID=UPI0004A4D9BB|nr:MULTISPECIES: VPA1267 family protein [unclassified Pseudoalteromonas]TMP83386.1 DNA replication initiation control protein YabA [Pseudoalteromonas sp. S983]
MSNLDKLNAWIATQSDEDFKQIVNRGKLHRGQIVKESGVGRTSLKENVDVKNALVTLEERLRQKGILPALIERSGSSEDQPKLYDAAQRKKTKETGRLALLEAENIELKAENKALKLKLERFAEVSEALSDMGFMPYE